MGQDYVGNVRNIDGNLMEYLTQRGFSSTLDGGAVSPFDQVRVIPEGNKFAVYVKPGAKEAEAFVQGLFQRYAPAPTPGRESNTADSGSQTLLGEEGTLLREMSFEERLQRMSPEERQLEARRAANSISVRILNNYRIRS